MTSAVGVTQFKKYRCANTGTVIVWCFFVVVGFFLKKVNDQTEHLSVEQVGSLPTSEATVVVDRYAQASRQ